MERGAHTLEFIFLFFFSGNRSRNERLLHLRVDPKPTEVKQKSCCLLGGFCVRPIVKSGHTCIVTKSRLCFLVLVVSPASSGSCLLGSPASAFTKELGI